MKEIFMHAHIRVRFEQLVGSWRSLRLVLLAILLSVAFGNLAIAGSIDEGGDASTRQYVSEAVRRVFVSAEIAAIGYEQRDPVHLVTAARLLAWAHPYPKRLGSGSRLMNPEGFLEAFNFKYDEDGLFRDAERLAGNKPITLELIRESRSRAKDEILRVGASGPNVHRDVISSRERVSYDVVFKANQIARVAIVGRPSDTSSYQDTFLDLLILDDLGKLVCSSKARNSFEFCEWTPTNTQRFQLVVENNAPAASPLALYWN